MDIITNKSPITVTEMEFLIHLNRLQLQSNGIRYTTLFKPVYQISFPDRYRGSQKKLKAFW